MVIYGEYLFLENFITGAMILYLTRKISGIHAAARRLAVGSVLCGLYAFILFIPISPAAALAAKLAFSFGLVRIVFGRAGRRRLFKTVLLFYFISFALGGISIGLMYFFEVPGVTSGGMLYMGGLGYALVSLTVTGAYLLLSVIVGWIREVLLSNTAESRITVGLADKKAELLGLVDTGNFLADPATGRQVFLISASSFAQLVSGDTAKILGEVREPAAAAAALAAGELAGRLSLIPYRSVGMENGLILGIRPDYIEVRKEGGDKRMRDVVLGVYHGDFGCGAEGEPYSVLLHQSAMEGGLVCHG